MTSAPTRREQLKADRRAQLLREGARLIAERGFNGTRMEDLGAAVGISGPALYRHFPNKEALLVELLEGFSDRLLAGGSAVVAADAPADALGHLIDFHLEFALGDRDIIRIQDRELETMPLEARTRVRRTQRQYVELWVGVLCALGPELSEADARTRAHAVFGLLNSTPHSAKSAPQNARATLRAMALAALSA
ncbi:MAG: TetR/AcrR family transcriptional regulator [Nocardiaceae bacterium]|nr:TetR/AcrR family transcriptional regulator [Nocardiaceae bacterium]